MYLRRQRRTDAVLMQAGIYTQEIGVICKMIKPEWTLVTTITFVPEDVVIKMNLLL